MAKKSLFKDSVNIPNYDQIIQLNQRLWNEFGEETPDLSLQSKISCSKIGKKCNY